jgi:hypothetical protein
LALAPENEEYRRMHSNTDNREGSQYRDLGSALQGRYIEGFSRGQRALGSSILSKKEIAAAIASWCVRRSQVSYYQALAALLLNFGKVAFHLFWIREYVLFC